MKKETAQKIIETTPGFDADCIALGDLQESPYFSTPEETIKSWPVSEQKKFEEEKQAFFTSTLLHGADGSVKPYAIGGSKVGSIFGYNRFCPASVLYEHLRYPQVYASERKDSKTLAAGHRAEPYIMDSFRLETGMEVYNWTVQMGNRNIPFGLIDVDGLAVEDGVLGVYEGKCPQVYATQKPWLEIKKRGNTPDCADLVPMDYFLQVQWAMLITGLPFAYICAGGWGMRQDDIAYVRIEKLPSEGQEALLEGVEQFVRNTERGIRPSDDAYPDKKRLLEEYSKMYTCMELSEKPVALPSSATDLIEQIRQAEAQKKQIGAKVKELEASLGLKETEEKAAAAKAALAEMMYTAKYGVAMDAAGKPVRVSYEFGRNSFDKDLCQEKYPEVFREVYRPKTRAIKLG